MEFHPSTLRSCVYNSRSFFSHNNNIIKVKLTGKKGSIYYTQINLITTIVVKIS